ncbi:MAG: ABC transporter ATP-binding protein/permease [Oscillospiraceae bacterium]|nr:ABC transporter ATP-binding protein/permease [Oscillospiraceae bacterium]
MAENRNSSAAPQPMIPRPGGGRRGPGPVMVVEKPKNAKETLIKLIKYIGSSRAIFIGLIIVMLIITALNLVAPSLQRSAIDAISADGVDFVKMGNMLALLLLTYALNAVFTYFQGIFSAKLSQFAVRKMRTDLFAKLVRLPIKYTDTHPHGDLMSRMTNDVENVSTTVSQSIGSLISSVLTVIGSLVIMIYYSPLLTLISISTIVLTIIVSAFMSRNMRKYFIAEQTLLGTLNGHIEEIVTGCKTVTAYNKQKDAADKFDGISANLKKAGIKAQIFGGAMGPSMNVISNIGFLLVAVFGGKLALEGAITIGTIQAFILYSKQFSRPINEIANQYAQIQSAIAGAERVFDIMEAETESEAGEIEFHSEDVKGDISFKNIQFSYVPEKPVLKGFDLEVKSGEKIAIVGATGSGKTTVVNLLMRFYDVDSGTITIDGKDISKVSKSELREAIAIVLQDTVLWDGTIADNIRYGRLSASNEEVLNAAESANADVFIDRLKDGYETRLSESGSNLSQGQQQLLSISRAVLKDPKILILDEATSSVDTRTEMNIQSAMVALMKNRTSLIIAHRLSTIRDADRIIVVDNGRVIESGNHEELLANKGAYYRLYKNQFEGIAT